MFNDYCEVARTIVSSLSLRAESPTTFIPEPREISLEGEEVRLSPEGEEVYGRFRLDGPVAVCAMHAQGEENKSVLPVYSGLCLSSSVKDTCIVQGRDALRYMYAVINTRGHRIAFLCEHCARAVLAEFPGFKTEHPSGEVAQREGYGFELYYLGGEEARREAMYAPQHKQDRRRRYLEALWVRVYAPPSRPDKPLTPNGEHIRPHENRPPRRQGWGDGRDYARYMNPRLGESQGIGSL